MTVELHAHPQADITRQRQPQSKQRLLIGDKSAIGLGVQIALEDLFEICAEVESETQAIRAAKLYRPELCVIGSGLVGDVAATVRGVCRAAPGARVIVLATGCNADDMLDAIRAGAVGYVPSDVGPQSLRRIVTAVAADEAALPRTFVLGLLRELQAGGDDEVSPLTRREAQVLGMLRRGHSTAGIAERLNVQPVTVRRHISTLVHKLGVDDRSELLADGVDGRPEAQSRWFRTA
jgi:DNA-binding NarL/FixJ family response regulator